MRIDARFALLTLGAALLSAALFVPERRTVRTYEVTPWGGAVRVETEPSDRLEFSGELRYLPAREAFAGGNLIYREIRAEGTFLVIDVDRLVRTYLVTPTEARSGLAGAVTVEVQRPFGPVGRLLLGTLGALALGAGIARWTANPQRRRRRALTRRLRRLLASGGEVAAFRTGLVELQRTLRRRPGAELDEAEAAVARVEAHVDARRSDEERAAEAHDRAAVARAAASVEATLRAVTAAIGELDRLEHPRTLERP